MQMEAPKTLADIHPDEALLLSTIKDFIKPFKEQYKKIKSKNREIKRAQCGRTCNLYKN